MLPWQIVADKGTKEVLLRLRRVRELELRRELVVQRADRAAARREAATKEGARRKLERALGDAQRSRQDAWGAPRAAGRLVYALGFERAVDDSLRRAKREEREASVRLDRAESALHAVQRALGDAVHARQRSESLQRTEKAAALRAAERREQAEAEDRWRPKRTT